MTLESKDVYFKGAQRAFYDKRYSIAGRALNKFSNTLMLFYDKRLFKLINSKFGGSALVRVLEVGAGQGSDAVTLSETSEEVVAIDISRGALLTAKTLSKLTRTQDKISVIQADAENLPFREGIYDAVYSRDVLHHVTNSILSVKEMKRVAKEKAKVVAIEANGLNPQMVVIGFLYYSVDHGVFRNTSTYLSNIFVKAGLKQVQIAETEFFPRHVFFEYRSPLNHFFVSHSFRIIELLAKLESSFQKNSFFSKFSNYLVVSASKITTPDEANGI